MSRYDPVTFMEYSEIVSVRQLPCSSTLLLLWAVLLHDEGGGVRGDRTDGAALDDRIRRLLLQLQFLHGHIWSTVPGPADHIHERLYGAVVPEEVVGPYPDHVHC